MFRKPFRLFGTCCLIAAAVWVSLGIATFFFEKTTGHIVQYSAAQTKAAGGFPGTPAIPGKLRESPDPGNAPNAFVVYEYEVAGLVYVESGFGFGARPWTFSPFKQMSWEQNARDGVEVAVYYLASRPQVSVLSKGFDQFFVVLLIGFGLCLRWFSRWIDSHG